VELTERSKRRMRRRKKVPGVSKQKWFRRGTPQLSFAKTTVAELQHTQKKKVELVQKYTVHSLVTHARIISTYVTY